MTWISPTGYTNTKISNLVDQLLDASGGGSGGGVSQAYVDGSLGVRDAEITALENYELVQDASILANTGSITSNDGEIAVLDASIVRIDGYFAGGYTGTFTADGSTVTVTDGLITAVTP